MRYYKVSAMVINRLGEGEGMEVDKNGDGSLLVIDEVVDTDNIFVREREM